MPWQQLRQITGKTMVKSRAVTSGYLVAWLQCNMRSLHQHTELKFQSVGSKCAKGLMINFLASVAFSATSQSLLQAKTNCSMTFCCFISRKKNCSLLSSAKPDPSFPFCAYGESPGGTQRVCGGIVWKTRMKVGGVQWDPQCPAEVIVMEKSPGTTHFIEAVEIYWGVLFCRAINRFFCFQSLSLDLL